jgi:hypothetical protein
VARFYSNENIAIQVVVELRRLGHDVLTTLDVGRANAAVPRHFLKLHQRRPTDQAGIVVYTFDPDFLALARRIDGAVGAEADMANGRFA